uniref:Uncharacterized protein n=1 Tax=Meloidogyne enterolobii TaxID=390850 RepID=A0A6V7UN12_MELEN|nr:unnamed protein product [Meloidogyne enterolobii]
MKNLRVKLMEFKKFLTFRSQKYIFLINILENITLEILEKYSSVRLEKFTDYYCNTAELACKKIKKVIGVYNDFLCQGGESENARNHYLTFGLFVFARKFIRSFFNLHGTNKYYDNLVERFNPGMNVSVSLLKYMKAYDLFEAKANEWILEMKKWNEEDVNPVSLEDIENSNYLPTAMVSKEK